MPKTLLLHQILKIRELTERSVVSDGLSISSLNQQDWVESKLFSTPMVGPACQHELVTPFSRASPISHSLSRFLPSLSQEKINKGRTRERKEQGWRKRKEARKDQRETRSASSQEQEHHHLNLHPWLAQELSRHFSWNHLSNPSSQSLHAWMKHGAWWSLHHLKRKIKVISSSTT